MRSGRRSIKYDVSGIKYKKEEENMRDRASTDFLSIKRAKNGQGVFANNVFKKGETVLEFRGKIFTKNNLPNPYDAVEDHYVQIEKDEYMGPSGGVDDFVNHSCEPSCGVKIYNPGIFLVAIRDIGVGEEITWDYSTTMDEDEWEMDCCCGSKLCRKKIRDYKYLPNDIQEKYQKLAIAPAYILRTKK